jgi:hypothetical protein
MTDKPTTTTLLADENLLRLTIARVLNPGPWEHKREWFKLFSGISSCSKCKKEYHYTQNVCSVPDLPTDPMEVLADRLVKKCTPTDMVMSALFSAAHAVSPMREGVWHIWWIFHATPAEQAICLLVALGEAEVG